jgi:hypothetical protein
MSFNFKRNYMPNNLDINTLETWLWDAACKIKGEYSTQIPYNRNH